jgi:hypothetical protein
MFYCTNQSYHWTDHDHVHLRAFYFHYPRPITLLFSTN